MCTWEGGPVWEHARRWRVGNPAGSAGGRLRVRDWDSIPDRVRPVRILSTQTAKTLTDMLAFCEFSFGPDTQTFRVAGVWILPTQTFEAFLGRKDQDSKDKKLRKIGYNLKNVQRCAHPFLKKSIRKIC